MEISNLKLHGIIEKLRMRLDDDCDEEGDLLLSIAEELLSLRRENRWIPFNDEVNFKPEGVMVVSDKKGRMYAVDFEEGERLYDQTLLSHYFIVPKAPEQS